jgi:hypothetical protein
MKKIAIICFTLISFFSVAQLPSEGMLLRYFLNGDAMDVSGNGYHGFASNVEPSPDRFGVPDKAMYFNGDDSYIEFPNGSELKPEFPISIAFWVKHESLNPVHNVLFSTSLEEDRNTGAFMTSSSTGAYAIGYGDGAYTYGADSRRSLVSNAMIDTLEWHHITVIFRSALDMEIWVDCVNHGGQYSGSGGPLEYSIFPGSIGKHDQHTSFSAYHFEGYIDDFAYWDRDLTEDEIVAICNYKGAEVNVSNIVEGKEILIFPNPSSGVFNIDYPSEGGEIVSVYNLVGELVHQCNLQSALDLSDLTYGMYFLEIRDEKQKITSKIQIVH